MAAVLPGYVPTGVSYDDGITLNIGAGGIVDTASGIAGRMTYVQSISLPVTAVASTPFTMSIPPGCILDAIKVYTTVAYAAGTDCKISVGNVAAGAQYVAAQTIAAIGVVALTIISTAAVLSFPTGSPNLFITLVQTGAASATGAAVLVVKYST